MSIETDLTTERSIRKQKQDMDRIIALFQNLKRTASQVQDEVQTIIDNGSFTNIPTSIKTVLNSVKTKNDTLVTDLNSVNITKVLGE